MKRLIFSASLVLVGCFCSSLAQIKGEPGKLLSVEDIDCKRLKTFTQRQQCEKEQAQAKALLDIEDQTGTRLGDRMAWQNKEHAPVVDAIKAHVVCERYDTRVVNHDTITIKDMSQEFKDGVIYLYLVVENNYLEEDIPRSYVEKMLPQTFAAKMSDDRSFKIGKGEWLNKDIRVKGRTPYKVRFTLNPEDAIVVKGMYCLAND